MGFYPYRMNTMVAWLTFWWRLENLFKLNLWPGHIVVNTYFQILEDGVMHGQICMFLLQDRCSKYWNLLDMFAACSSCLFFSCNLWCYQSALQCPYGQDWSDQKEVPYMWVVFCTGEKKSKGRLLNCYHWKYCLFCSISSLCCYCLGYYVTSED